VRRGVSGHSLAGARRPLPPPRGDAPLRVTSGDVDGADVSGLTIVRTGQPARLSGSFRAAGSEPTTAKTACTRIDPFGIQYEGKGACSCSRFARAAT
jgi:hypothetical protein